MIVPGSHTVAFRWSAMKLMSLGVRAIIERALSLIRKSDPKIESGSAGKKGRRNIFGGAVHGV